MLSNKNLKQLGFKKDPNHDTLFLHIADKATLVACIDRFNPNHSMLCTVIGSNKNYRSIRKSNKEEYIKIVTMHPHSILTERVIFDTIVTIKNIDNVV